MRRIVPMLFLSLLPLACARVPPPFTVVEGTVLLDNKPLPNARVEFAPMLEGFGIELHSEAITDAEGRYSLVCPAKDQTGAVVGKHRVIVSDLPVPENMRGISKEAQETSSKYLNGLKNRPIPDEYTSLVKTPLVVEVTMEQKKYALSLTRKK